MGVTVKFDHLVVAAKTLEEGIAYVAERLGVAPQGGGKHLPMGTHNKLLRLEDDSFVEVIAADPDGATPDVPRWFGLDSGEVRSRLAQGPYLVTWVARTNDIEAATARSPFSLAGIRPMRRGGLSWRFSFTEDGENPLGGLVPRLIQWDRTPHPASRLPASGCTLLELSGFHPEPERVRAVLEPLGLQNAVALVRADAPALRATFQTPSGVRVLE